MSSKWLKVTQRLKGRFEMYFGAPLKFYFDGITGFDYSKFHNQLYTNLPDSISLSEYIEEVQGKEAAEIITELINV